MYQVVIFKKDNSIQEVPTKWLESDLCSWPPKKASKLIKTNGDACPEWDKFEIKRLGQPCATLKEAREKGAKAESGNSTCTGVKACEETKNKRRKRTRTVAFSTHSNSDEKKKKKDKKKKKSKKKKETCSSSSSSEEISSESESESDSSSSSSSSSDQCSRNSEDDKKRKKKTKTPLPPIFKEAPKSKDVGEESISMKLSTPVVTESRNGGGRSSAAVLGTSSDETVTNGQIHRRILIVEAICLRLDEAVKECRSLIIESRPDNAFGNILNVGLGEITNRLPVRSSEELEQLNGDLRADGVLMGKMIKFCSSIGGENTKKLVKKIMYKTMVDQLALEYNWTGRRRNGKKKFKCFQNLRNTILATVKANRGTAGATEADVASGIKEFLKRAPDRIKKAETAAAERSIFQNSES